MSASYLRYRGILIALSTDKDYYPWGEPINISLLTLNNSFNKIPLTYTTSQRFDFVASDFDTAWRWSNDRIFLPVVKQVTLRPGQPMAFTVAWDQKDNEGNQLPPGIYQVSGWNTAREIADIKPSLYLRIY